MSTAQNAIPPGVTTKSTARGLLLRRNNAHEGNSMRTKPRIIALVAAIFAALALVIGGVTIANADAGDEPAHSKTQTDNGDGTYKLELSVTGDADTTKLKAKANVLVVFDTSNSMVSHNVTRSDGTTVRRADASEKVLYDFISQLYGIEDAEINGALVTFNHTASPSVAWTSDEDDFLDKLSSTGNNNTAQLSYSSGTNFEAAFDAAMDMLDGLSSAAAADPTFVVVITDGMPSQKNGDSANTYYNTYDNQYQEVYDRAEVAFANARTIVTDGGTLYGIYSYGSDEDYLDDVIHYSLTGEERQHARIQDYAAIEDDDLTGSYFNATNLSGLEDAIASIFEDIADTLGITTVTITDGTTSNVTVQGGTAHLLDVDDGSFEYWISIPCSNNQFTRVDPYTGVSTTYTLVDNVDGTITVKNGDTEVKTVEGTISDGQFKFKWTDASVLSNGKTPPAANFDGEKVTWDLTSVETLLDKVTYSVSFDVWPSQYTYDLIAQMKNGDIQYQNLDAGIRQYLHENYSLDTNTTASLSYKDTRLDNPKLQTTNYDPPRPVPTVSRELQLKKNWDPIDDAVDSMKLTVTCDGDHYFDVTLGEDNQYQDKVNISTGLMRVSYNNAGHITGARVLDPGHDYAFEELGASSHDWDLDAQTVRPMLINSANDISTLVLVENAEEAATIDAAMNGEIYLEQGGTTYFKIEGHIYELSTTGTEGNLEADNVKRSHLSFFKEVTGDAPEGDEFTFNITVNAAYAEHTVKVTDNGDGTYSFTTVDGQDVTVAPDEKSPLLKALYYVADESGDPDDSDSVVLYGTVTDGEYTYREAQWFTKWDGTGLVHGLEADFPAYTEEVINGTRTGYYYAPVGTPLEGVTLTEIENIRFSHVPRGTTYTITETDLPDNYEFVKTTEQYTTRDTNQTVFVKESDEVTTSGEVEHSNTDYAVTVTNEYSLVKLTVNKEWDGTPKDSIEVQLMQDGQPYLDPVTITADDNWTYTFKDLPKNEGDHYFEYTAVETAIDGYKTTYSGTADVTVEVTGATPDEEVTVTIGDKSGTATADEDGWAEVTVDDVEYYDKDGNAIELEVNASPGQATITSVVNRELTITNQEVTKVTVTKVWDDNNDQDGKRPDSVDVQLLANGEAVGDPVTLDETNKHWTHTWEELPVNADGEPIEYDVDEVDVGNDYESEKGDVEGNAKDGFTVTVTNTHTPEVTTVEGEKQWDDDKYSSEAATAEGVDNQYATVPVQITLTGSDGNTYSVELDGSADTAPTGAAPAGYEYEAWKFRFVNLPKYQDGVEITYAVTETAPDGWTVTYDDGNTVINTPDEHKKVNDTTITIKKVDANTEGGLAGAVFTLTPTDPEGEAQTFTTGTDGTVTIDFAGYESDEDVDVAKSSTYTLQETTAPTGYTADPTVYTITVDEELKSITKVTRDSKTFWEWLYDLVADIDAENFDGENLTLTVENPPQKTKVTVTKVWDDENNKSDKRPATLTYTLTGKAGNDTAYSNEHGFATTATGDTGTIAKGEVAEAKFTNKHTEDKKDVFTGTVTTSIDGHVVEPGQELTYEISYTNNTSGTADVEVEDTIPQYTEYVEGSASDGGQFAGGKVTWTIPGVAAGASGKVSFKVKVSEVDEAYGATLENKGIVRVGENESDTNPVTTTVPKKEVSGENGITNLSPVQVGDVLTYDVTFKVDKPVVKAVVTDGAPEGTEYVAGSAEAAWATAVDDSDPEKITWSFVGDEGNTLAAGTYTATFQVRVTEAALKLDEGEPGEIVNTGHVKVNDDPEVDTNTVTNPPTTGDLYIDKTVVSDRDGDDQVDFTFTVTLRDKAGEALSGEYKYDGSKSGAASPPPRPATPAPSPRARSPRPSSPTSTPRTRRMSLTRPPRPASTARSSPRVRSLLTRSATPTTPATQPTPSILSSSPTRFPTTPTTPRTSPMAAPMTSPPGPSRGPSRMSSSLARAARSPSRSPLTPTPTAT